jgi:hypothetical protein
LTEKSSTNLPPKKAFPQTDATEILCVTIMCLKAGGFHECPRTWSWHGQMVTTIC